MSPRNFTAPASEAVQAAERRLWTSLGIQLRDARLSRRWTVRQVAHRAGLSRSVVYLIEAGQAASTESAVRIAGALGLRLELDLVDPRRRAASEARPQDPVHAAMGEFEAGHLRRLGYGVGIDEPYQHYQFAGRADVVAWDADRRRLLHLENRTRLPNLQETAGSFNSKRAYLGSEIARRAGIRRWTSETHVIVGLWSAEVLHTLRLRTESFRSICPDSASAFANWWNGSPPDSGVTSALVLLDPLASRRRTPFIGFERALSARPRHRGYADVAIALLSPRRAG